MLKRISKFFFFLVFFIFNNSILNCQTDKNTQKIAATESHKKDSIEQKIKKIESQIKKKKEELADLEAELKDLKTKIKKDIKVPQGKQVFYDLGSGLGKVTIHAYLYDPNDKEKAKKFMNEEYKDIRAEISEEERSMISKGQMGSPVYGEIKVNSFEKLLEDPDLNITGFKKAVGIELSPTRHHHAVTISKLLKERDLEIPGKKLEFLNENIAESDLSDADVIFMCSTCYPDPLMETLSKKLSKLKNGLIVMSLKSLPDYAKYGFKKIKELSLPMTWSEGSPVYIYKLNKSQSKQK